jgi:dihydrofolate reductase
MIAIFCTNTEGYIGRDNKLIYRFKEDMQMFKAATSHKDTNNLIMGGKTFRSLPKVLEGRKHWVISRTGEGIPTDNPDVVWIDETKIDTLPTDSFVIGGKEIFELLKDKIDTMVLTVVFDDTEGDTKINPDMFGCDILTSRTNKQLALIKVLQPDLSYKEIELPYAFLLFQS